MPLKCMTEAPVLTVAGAGSVTSGTFIMAANNLGRGSRQSGAFSVFAVLIMVMRPPGATPGKNTY